jgi:hypothetical protein
MQSVSNPADAALVTLHPEQGAVVDPSGRVFGTNALSVIDASIMPDVPSGFTHIPTIMIAERLSEQFDPVNEEAERTPQEQPWAPEPSGKTRPLLPPLRSPLRRGRQTHRRACRNSSREHSGTSR